MSKKPCLTTKIKRKVKIFCFFITQWKKSKKMLCNPMNFLLIFFCRWLIFPLHGSICEWLKIMKQFSVSITVDFYFSFVSASQTFYEHFSYFSSHFSPNLYRWFHFSSRTAKNNPGEIFSTTQTCKLRRSIVNYQFNLLHRFYSLIFSPL